MRGRLGTLLLAITLAAGCGDDVNMGTGGRGGVGGGGGGTGGNPGGSGGGGAGGGAGSGGGGGSAGCGTTQCSDCIDNDGDGLIDSADPECTGPLDNDESSFATGIPGDNMDPCKQDCFFDGNSGQGDDGCNWNLGCEPTPAERNGCRALDPSTPQCMMQTGMCQQFCGRLTPNGCDCFGCCTVYDAAGVPHDVRLVASCTADKLSDPVACPPCTKTTTCGNPCDPCEYCLGRPPTMNCNPDGGTPDGGSYMCPNNEVPCNPIDRNCPANYYCLTGCCIPNIP